MLMSNAHYPDAAAYPGASIPNKLKFETPEKEIFKPGEGEETACNISETTEYYKIELAVPGFQREDFFVNVAGNGHLYISALHAEKDKIENEQYRKQTFSDECYQRELSLPENVDTDFFKSEYRSGVLSFWFSKTEKQYQKTASTIIVY